MGQHGRSVILQRMSAVSAPSFTLAKALTMRAIARFRDMDGKLSVDLAPLFVLRRLADESSTEI